MKKIFLDLDYLSEVDFPNIISSGIKGFTRGALVASAVSIIGGFAVKKPSFEFFGITIITGSIIINYILIYFAIGGGLITALIAMIVAYIDNKKINDFFNEMKKKQGNSDS